MLAIVGTVPDDRFPMTLGPVTLSGDHLVLGDHRIPVNRGTPALIGSALMAAEVLGGVPILACLAGDIGLGGGSRALYRHLTEHLKDLAPDVLCFHYLQPDVDWHNRILFTVDDMERRPILIADAGFMYAAKMSGQASAYDLFTPDVGELAFLADEIAPHPFYTRGFILHEDNRVPDLIARACANDNAARHLMVKGQPDYVVEKSRIMAAIDGPSSAAMEAVGGTGDTLTGIISALAASGMPIVRACTLGARTNRLAGALSNPTPATQVMDIIRHIPGALSQALKEEPRP
ncbi:NAD(P)H-hydrate dehydratase [Desulfatiferula olefinivorans]